MECKHQRYILKTRMPPSGTHGCTSTETSVLPSVVQMVVRQQKPQSYLQWHRWLYINRNLSLTFSGTHGCTSTETSVLPSVAHMVVRQQKPLSYLQWHTWLYVNRNLSLTFSGIRGCMSTETLVLPSVQVVISTAWYYWCTGKMR